MKYRFEAVIMMNIFFVCDSYVRIQTNYFFKNWEAWPEQLTIHEEGKRVMNTILGTSLIQFKSTSTAIEMIL